VPDGPLVIGVDETIERRWGRKIAAKGVYRDPVRSTRETLVKTSGLRWISMLLLAPIPWAVRVWALPFLTVLAPSERYNRDHHRHHRTIIDWARQMLLLVRRWYPDRSLVFVGDSTYSTIPLLVWCQSLANPVTLITRLRLDAALYEPAPPRRPGQMGRPRLKGKRLPTLAKRLHDPDTEWSTIVVPTWYGDRDKAVEVLSGTAVWYHAGMVPAPIRWVLVRDPLHQFKPVALLSTDRSLDPVRIVMWFTWRWQVEVTYEESRRHLGMETQRQWSDLGIQRTTPCLLGLFSLVTLLVHQEGNTHTRQETWYHKARPTFADALALVRKQLWTQNTFCMSDSDIEMVKVPRIFVQSLTDALCYAA
jgi:hypothetical protein